VTLSAQDVAEITRLLQESQFDELHIESDGFKLTLRRGAIARNQGMGVAGTGTAQVVAPARHHRGHEAHEHRARGNCRHGR
jgi:hypothetical protein